MTHHVYLVVASVSDTCRGVFVGMTEQLRMHDPVVSVLCSDPGVWGGGARKAKAPDDLSNHGFQGIGSGSVVRGVPAVGE